MLHLTPDMIEAAYELLRTTRPFRGWKLPPGDEVQFHVTSCDTHGADYQWTGTHHRIRINAKWCGSLARMVVLLAHEMVHLHLENSCPDDRAHHGARFRRCAATVCQHHVFDPGAF